MLRSATNTLFDTLFNTISITEIYVSPAILNIGPT
jgi:hypothetical protein